MSNLLDLYVWRKYLGFFPHALFQKKYKHEKYILLNGKNGNFCVDYTDESPNNCRSFAWSSNVGYYLTISGDKLKLYRWDKQFPEELSVNRVRETIETFSSYLSRQRINDNHNSINLSLSLYRQLRGSIRDKKGEDSLNALLCAFAMHEDKASLRELDHEKWGLTRHALESASKINDSTWERVLARLNEGVPELNIKTKVELLLRHASGKIFQEAHYEALFPPQLSFDFVPQEINIHKSSTAYSSHYTPTSIVRSIVEETLNYFDFKEKKEIIIFDPAVGSGEFLKEALRQLSLKGYNRSIKLLGWDVSQSAIDLAKFSLFFEKQACPNPSNIEIKLEVKNSLTTGNVWNVKPDLIFMNPPFISWENMNNDDKEKLQNILGSNFKKKPNLAGAFLWKAANSLSEGGRMGCIVPSSILEADSFIELRKSLLEIIHIDFIGKLGSLSIFEQAIADASILISSKATSNKPTELMWSDNSNDSYASGLRELRKLSHLIPTTPGFIFPGSNFNFYSVNNLNNKNWTPIDFDAYQLINRLGSMKTVKDLFEIKQGVRTGLNKAFIISKEFLQKLPKSEQKYFRPAITNNSIKFGCLNDNDYIFYAEGQYAIKSERELKQVVKNFYTLKFSAFIQELSARSRNSIEDYWRLTRHRKWQLEVTPKIVSKEFGMAGSFAFDEKGIYVAERSHAWLPKQNKGWNEIGFGYVSILSMNIINDLLKGLSKQITSGSYYLSSQFLNDLPLPDLFDNSINEKIKKELIAIGKELSKGNYNNTIKSRLENLTVNIY